MPSAALIIVNYKAASLAIEAIRTARAASSQPLQVIVVDNSVDVAEAERLRPHADSLLVSDRNDGYAGAINRGRRVADAETLIVSNPDVRFGLRAIDELLAVGAAVRGPALYWDDAYEWMLPPSELHTTREVLDRAIASRSRGWAKRRDRRRIRERLRFWSLQTPARVRALSGAVLAIQSAAFDRAGGFDERFPLYFEENDFLRRVAGDVMYVPASRCRHIYNQSAGSAPHAAAAFDTSRHAYLEKWSGANVTRVLERLERPREAAHFPPIAGDAIPAGPDTLVEASPVATFETAAGHLPRSARVRIPDEVWTSYRDKSLYFRVIDRGTGEVLATGARSRIAS